MTWARRSLTRFPKIAELRTFIEGDPEDHANRSWNTLLSLLSAEAEATVILTDAVVAQTLINSFGSWPQTCQAISHLDGNMARSIS